MEIAAKDSFSFIEKAPVKVFADIAATHRAAFYQVMAGLRLKEASRISDGLFYERLFRIGESAYRKREMGTVEIVADILMSYNKPEGEYFRGLCLYHEKLYNEARTIFENMLPITSGRLKARIALGLSAIIHDSKAESSLPFYLLAQAQGLKDWCDPYVVLTVQRMVAVTKGIEGDHRNAVRDLENLYPLAKAIAPLEPFAFNNYLNSLAVEKGETGEIQQALRISRFILASPFAAAYPEWRETNVELLGKERHRSKLIVALGRIEQDNVLYFGHTNTPAQITSSEHKAKVASLEEWKNEMANKAKINQPENPAVHSFSQLSHDQKQNHLACEILKDDLSDDELIKLMNELTKLRSERRQEGKK